MVFSDQVFSPMNQAGVQCTRNTAPQRKPSFFAGIISSLVLAFGRD
jgi:hypothetical protein